MFLDKVFNEFNLGEICKRGGYEKLELILQSRVDE